MRALRGDELSLAYAAGLFDGEGSIVITKPTPSEPRRHALHCTMRMTCEKTVRAFHSIVKVGSVVAVDTPRYNPQFKARSAWGWQVVAQEAEDFLRLVEPHLITKAVAAELALEFRALKMRKGVHDPAVLVAREELRQQLSDVNNGR